MFSLSAKTRGKSFTKININDALWLGGASEERYSLSIVFVFLHSDYVQLLQKAMQKVEFSKMENIEFVMKLLLYIVE